MKKSIDPAKRTKYYRAHKQNVLWQILIPMFIVVALFATASVFTAMSPAETASQWADVSTIWLLIPVIIFALVNLLILAGLIYGLAKLLDITPTYTQKLYGLILLAKKKIESFADSAAKPIFMIEGFSASLRRVFRKK